MQKEKGKVLTQSYLCGAKNNPPFSMINITLFHGLYQSWTVQSSTSFL